MRMGRIAGAVVAFGLLAYSVALAVARPPADDAGREAAIDGMYQGFRGMFSGVPEVTASELLAEVKAGNDTDLVLVDVREPAEQSVSMLPGAIPASKVESDPAAFQGKHLVAYCTIGYRSGQWAKKMRAEGLDVTNLAGSLLAWTHVGGPLVHDGQPTKAVHVYGSKWNLARTDYTAVY